METEAVQPKTSQTETEVFTEQKKENDDFLALLIRDNEVHSEKAADTFEFSFQLFKTVASVDDIKKRTLGLTDILDADKADETSSFTFDFNTSQQQSVCLTSEITTNFKESVDPSMDQFFRA